MATKQINLPLRLSSDEHDRLRVYAAVSGLPMVEVARRAVRDWLDDPERRAELAQASEQK